MALDSPLFSKALATIAIGGISMILTSCETCPFPPASSTTSSKAAAAPQRGYVSKSGTHATSKRYIAIAEREVVRRKEMVRQADEAAMNAREMQADGNLQGAVDGYRRAINLLPN